MNVPNTPARGPEEARAVPPELQPIPSGARVLWSYEDGRPPHEVDPGFELSSGRHPSEVDPEFWRRPGKFLDYALQREEVGRRKTEFLWNTQRTFLDLIDGVTDPKQLMDMVMPGSPNDLVAKSVELVGMGMGDSLPDEATRAVGMGGRLSADAGSGIVSDAGGRFGTDDPADSGSQEAGPAVIPERTPQDDMSRSLGLNARMLLDGILGVPDTIAFPARVPVNLINGLLGGNPNYFPPFAGNVPDAMGLPRPKTDIENICLQVNSNLLTLLLTGGLGSWLSMGKAGTGLAGTQMVGSGTIGLTGLQRLGKTLTAKPGLQAAATTAASTAMALAQNAGLGQAAQTVIGIITALAVSKVALGSAELGTGRAAVSGAATEARAVKAGPAAMAEGAAGAAKAGTRVTAEEAAGTAKTGGAARTAAGTAKEAGGAALEASTKERRPTVVLTGKEFAGETPAALRAEAADWYKKYLAGTTAQHPTLGEFHFTGNARKPLSFSADSRVIQLFPKLRDIITTSEHLASSQSIKPRHAGTMDYHYLGTTVQLGNELVDVGVILRKDSTGQFYYHHIVDDARIIETAPWASQVKSAPGGTLNLFILGTRPLRAIKQGEQDEE